MLTRLYNVCMEAERINTLQNNLNQLRVRVEDLRGYL